MKNAGKARSYGLYRHLRTSKEIIENLLNYLLQTKGGLHPYCQDKDRLLLPIFIGYRTDLIPPPPLIEFSLIFGITAIITV